MGVSEINPEASGSLPKVAKPSREMSQIRRDQSQLHKNEFIILVLPQQFYQQNNFIMMQNVCFCLKGQCFSKLSAIFVVLIM